MAEKNTQVATQNQTQVSTNKVTDFSLGIFGTSDNFIMANQMAKALSSSTIVPREYQGNVSNCLVAIEQANRLKVSPLMVMQNLYVIQGRPSWSSKFLIAAINGSGKFDMELQYEETKDKDGKPYSCLAWTTKNGRRVEGMTVDMQMAKDEGWLTKNGSKWKTMPALMLRYRAASFFSSLNCPELTLGLYTKEEAETIEDYDAIDVEAQVKHDIETHANQQEFVVEESAQIEEKPEPKTVADVVGQQKEKEPVGKDMNVPAKEKKEQSLPDFMKMSE